MVKRVPIGQVLLAGREQGHNLLSASLTIDPDKNDLYAVTSDGAGGRGHQSSTPGCFLMVCSRGKPYGDNTSESFRDDPVSSLFLRLIKIGICTLEDVFN